MRPDGSTDLSSDSLNNLVSQIHQRLEEFLQSTDLKLENFKQEIQRSVTQNNGVNLSALADHSPELAAKISQILAEKEPEEMNLSDLFSIFEDDAPDAVAKEEIQALGEVLNDDQSYLQEILIFQQQEIIQVKSLFYELNHEKELLIQQLNQATALLSTAQSSTEIDRIKEKISKLEEEIQPLVSEQQKKAAILAQQQYLLNEAHQNVTLFYRKTRHQLRSLFASLQLFASGLVDFNTGVLPPGRDAKAINDVVAGVKEGVKTAQKVASATNKGLRFLSSVVDSATPLFTTLSKVAKVVKPVADALPIAGAVVGVVAKGAKAYTKYQEKGTYKKLDARLGSSQENDVFAESIARKLALCYEQQLECLQDGDVAEEFARYAVDRIILAMQCLAQTTEEGEALADSLLQEIWNLEYNQGTDEKEIPLGIFRPKIPLIFSKEGKIKTASPQDKDWVVDKVFRAPGYRCAEDPHHPELFSYYSLTGVTNAEKYGYRQVTLENLERLKKAYPLLKKDSIPLGPASLISTSLLSNENLSRAYNRQLQHLTRETASLKACQERETKTLQVENDHLKKENEKLTARLTQLEAKLQTQQQDIEAIKNSLRNNTITPITQSVSNAATERTVSTAIIATRLVSSTIVTSAAASSTTSSATTPQAKTISPALPLSPQPSHPRSIQSNLPAGSSSVGQKKAFFLNLMQNNTQPPKKSATQPSSAPASRVS